MAAPVAMPQGWNETTRVHLEKILRFRVGIDFVVLVLQFLELEGDPDALYEGAEAGAEQLEVVGCRMSLGRAQGVA